MCFRNPESKCWIAHRCLIFASIQNSQQLCPLAMSSLKNTCFHIQESLPQFENRIMARCMYGAYVPKSSILLAGTGVWKNSSVALLKSIILII